MVISYLLVIAIVVTCMLMGVAVQVRGLALGQITIRRSYNNDITL